MPVDILCVCLWGLLLFLILSTLYAATTILRSHRDMQSEALAAVRRVG